MKASLHRGRARLGEIADEADDAPQPRLSETERAQLSAYVAHFNARDFDAIRAMIADGGLDLVNRSRMRGKAEASKYSSNYSLAGDWRLVPGFVEDRPAILVFDPEHTNGPPKYFMQLGWHGGRSPPSGISVTRAMFSTGPSTASDRPKGARLKLRHRSPENRHYNS